MNIKEKIDNRVEYSSDGYGYHLDKRHWGKQREKGGKSTKPRMKKGR